MRVDLRQPKRKVPNKKTVVENLLHDHLQEAGLTGYVRNARFIEGRKFEADFWFPALKIALEVDGGVWLPKSGHTSGIGYTADRERDVEALLQGILTIRYTSDQVRNRYAINTFSRIVQARAEGGVHP